MRQWRDAKARHPDALLFFRVGDFYELFHEDAQEGARLLGLTLTSRNNGAAARVPLAGVPAKALDDYLARLVRLGRRVAICDQTEDPALAKGIVKREVTETLTPGTVLADNLLRERANNWLASLVPDGEAAYGLAMLDVSTGELFARRVAAADLEAELGRHEPAELLVPRALAEAGAEPAASASAAPRTVRDDWIFDEAVCRERLCRAYGVSALDGFGFQAADSALARAAGALLHYLEEIRPGGASHLQPPRIVRDGRIMQLDEMTRRNLELTEPLRAGEEGGTLLGVLDEAVTAMGGRLLRRWVLEPLVVAEEIWARQDGVAWLVQEPEARRALRDVLRQVGDLERLAGKLGTGRALPRDVAALRRALGVLPEVRAHAGG
ncbi:MAG TPA: hypothetical protein VFQ22_07475, partial [Longimicrobiales bacterium]|nr:hypothetical protein [Longimicrobiales bacterium]